MTDDELDALVKRAKASLMHREQYSTMEIYPTFLMEMIAAITTLRAERDDARAERDKMGRALNVARYGQPDFSWELHKMAMREAVEQRDRAEAALAAQIEVEPVAWRWESCANSQGWNTRYGCEKPTPSDYITDIVPLYATQPHDRSALDRVRAEAREKALREAAGEMEDERAKQAILTLIERPAPEMPIVSGDDTGR